MPTVTGQAYSPERRPNVELQYATQPGYYLSSAVSEDPRGSGIEHVSGMFDPEGLIGAHGLGVGARVVESGKSSAYVEPMVRYRAYTDEADSVALGGILYGGFASEAAEDGSYSATRLGGEYGMDYRVTAKNRYVEVHLVNGLGLLYLNASGSYCRDAESGYAADCSALSSDAQAQVRRAFLTVFGGLNLDIARHIRGIFHGARISFNVAAGEMPRVREGADQDGIGYISGGGALTLMLGGI